MPLETDPPFGVVAIGRNEGERLKGCLRSIPPGVPTVYVDSASSDGSASFARALGTEVVDLDLARPFTAARARNEGFARLSALHPSLPYVQFVDGDCEIEPSWFAAAIDRLNANPDLAVVCGRRKERFPDASFYNAMADDEWDTPIGKADACGGDAMIRADLFAKVNGYDEGLLAHEEPDMCSRMRQHGMMIERIDALMTHHDAAITRFSQWWRRNVRGGYGYTQAALKHGRSPYNPASDLFRRTLQWGIVIPAIALVLSVVMFPVGLLAWLVYPLHILRQTRRFDGSFSERLRRAFFDLLVKFAEARGVLSFVWDKVRSRQRHSITYK